MNQAFESGGFSGGGYGGGITRRSFIKRTGGATVAALVAWNLDTARAQDPDEESSTGSSGSWYITCIGVPDSLSENWILGASTVNTLSASLSLNHSINPKLGETRPIWLGFQIKATLTINAIPEFADMCVQNLEVFQSVVGTPGSSSPVFILPTDVDSEYSTVKPPNHAQNVNTALRISNGGISSVWSRWTEYLVELHLLNPAVTGYKYSFFVHQ